MKTQKQNPVLLILLFVLSLSLSSFGSKNEDSLYVIEIDGRVLIPKMDESKIYKVELLCHNTVIDSGFVVDGESFLMKIMKNSWYTVRITKEGYHPLSVAIDTRLPEANEESYSFHFDVELIATTRPIVDKDAIDFPIAIVAFNPKRDYFEAISEYTHNIKKCLFESQDEKESFAKIY